MSPSLAHPAGAGPARGAPEPIAIVGFSFKFPGGCETADSFWQALIEKRNTSSDAPADRYSADSLYHPDTSRRGTVAFRGGHYLSCDVSKFDAPFFSISDTEAAALDPQQRILLETTFRALENAGQSLTRVSGSNTSVFTGTFNDDWKFLSFKDGEQCASHAAIGGSCSMLANRISWFFNLKGASCSLDAACSSGLLAVDLACKSLANGDSNMGIAAGCNLLMYPDHIHALSNLGLCSPDSQSYSFDSRANGYARGDGIGVVVLKRLSDAIADGDVIRAVIRGFGSNQDGRTPGITTPSGEAQAALIKSTYARAGLSLAETRFVEAHGTGTATGDPIEIDSIGSSFRPYRSVESPLYVGAVKSNIGHLEGTSGIAGLIKTVLILEKGVIAPNTNFIELNPKIDVDFLRVKLPLEATKWPSKGLRRASVNSFGFGGSNSHIILDDAYHYLQAAGLKGNHNTVVDNDSPDEDLVHVDFNPPPTPPSSERAMDDITFNSPAPPKLIVLSAYDESTLQLQADAHARFFKDTPLDDEFLTNVAYTLNERRNAFPWRSAALLNSATDLTNFGTLLSKPYKATEEPALCLVFTGQGAQYPGEQLRALEQFEVFCRRLNDAEDYLVELGCQWGVREELYKSADASRIHDAEFSQPLSTIVQLGLIDLLWSFGVYPSVVVGHSSGEIAAAYCSGALSARSAIKVAYFRGYHSAALARSGTHNGAMLAVGLGAKDARAHLDRLASQGEVTGLTIACINSPKSVTISGPADQVEALEKEFTNSQIFARRLQVNMAYHSSAMQAISQQYYDSIGKLEKGTAPTRSVTMLSSVTSEWVREEKLRTPQYWVDNMVSPVQFSPAVERLTFQANRKIWKRLDCSHRNHPRVTFLLEVGFHGALRGPLRDILSTVPGGSKVTYETVLSRNQPSATSLLNAVGQLFCHGYPVDLSTVNGTRDKTASEPRLLSNLPEYAFNHTKSHWHESRVSKRYRLHPQQKLDLLGKPSPDWNPAEAKWRNFIRTAEMPWVEDHKINDTVIYPGAGMLVMAIEAANQIADPGREIEGFELKDIRFLSTLPIPRTANGVETSLFLRKCRDIHSNDAPWSDFRLFYLDHEDWVETCRGSIRVQYEPMRQGSDSDAIHLEKLEEAKAARERESTITGSEGEAFNHEELYTSLRGSGFDFGSSFQLLRNGIFGKKQARADVRLYEWEETAFPQEHIIHPCSLDAILHLTVAAYAEGGNASVPTAIPSALRKLWVSKAGLSSPDSRSVRTSSWITDENSRGIESNASVLDATGDKLLLKGEGLQLTIVANASSSTEDADEKQVCYHLDWKPAAGPIHSGFQTMDTEVEQPNGKLGDHFEEITDDIVNVIPKVSQPIVVADLSSCFQQDTSMSLEAIVAEEYHIMSLRDASELPDKGERSFIFLEELEQPKLLDLSESDYSALQSILTTCKASLWVTNGGGNSGPKPSDGVASGLFRVLRNERPDVPYATLGLDVNDSITENQIYQIHKVFKTISQFPDPATNDQEYLEIDGVLHTPRVVEAKDITESVVQGTRSHRTTTQAIKDCPPVQLSIASAGFLDTLQFIEDDVYHQPLESDEVEIVVCAAGLNFRDVLIALGRLPIALVGSEAAGIVTRVGSSSLHVVPGDRVVMVCESFRTFARTKAHRVLKIDDSMTFPEAASMATQFCTAWQALDELARLQPDESILIHTGAGGTGQAAIQVAQYIGATIYATVGSEAKKKVLVDTYGIPEAHIFHSRNTSFAKGIMRVTNGVGVDVVLNSLAGDALIATWECIAPYGRFIEIGKKDILQNSNLPMGMFKENTQFICLDAGRFWIDRPKVFTRIFQKVMALFKEGKLKPVQPLNIFPVDRVEDAFRAMQDGKVAGKVVLDFAKDVEIKTTLRSQPRFTIDGLSTYVIAGGLGGLGRNVARWLVDRGARHLLLLSRSGARSEAAQNFVRELKARDVVVRAPPCDVTSFEAVKEVVDEHSRELPPIKGCVQGSMVLRDFTFDKMSYKDWRLGTDCKTVGSWNLHQLLPKDLDFFIMLSSASGVVGLHGQANYAAGNAYMDALARHRVSQGLRGTSLDMGALTEDGLLAEQPEFLNRVLSYGALNGISRNYFNAIMDHYCDPSLPPQTPTQSQPIIGICTSDDAAANNRAGSLLTSRPLFSNIALTNASSRGHPSRSTESRDWRAVFADPAIHDVPSLVSDALVRKLAKTNSSLEGEIDVFRPLVAYGVDSLLAVEVRSWLAKEFAADVALFEIQGGVGFEGLGRIVAARSAFVKGRVG